MRLLVSITIFLIVGTLLFPYTTNPREWDPLFYLGAAHTTGEQAWVLNRYMHIYALSGLMFLLDDPLLAGRMLWTVSVAATFAIISYTLLRLLSRTQAWVAMLLAAIAYFSHAAMLHSAGLPQTDIAIMPLLVGSAALVLTRLHGASSIRLIDAFLLGLMLFMAFKIKEVGVILALLPAVFFLREDQRFHFDVHAVVLVLAWLCGLALGQLALSLLDWHVLGDFWFSLRQQNWATVLEFNVGQAPPPSPSSFLALALGDTYGPLTVAYLVAAILYLARRPSPAAALVIALPLVYLAMLSALDILTNLRAIERYLIPLAPMMALVIGLGGTSFIEADTSKRQAPWLVAITAMALTGLLLLYMASTTTGPLGLIDAAAYLPLAVFSCMLAGLLATTPTPLLRSVGLALFSASLLFGTAVAAYPMAHNVFSGELKREADVRFRDFRQLVAQLPITRKSHIQFDERLLDRDLFRRFAPRVVMRLYEGIQIPSRQVQFGERDGYQPDFLILHAHREPPQRLVDNCQPISGTEVTVGRYHALRCATRLPGR